MRRINLLFLTVVAAALVLGSAEGACSGTSCSGSFSGVWPGANYIGLNQDMPDPNNNRALEIMAVKPKDGDSKNGTVEEAGDLAEAGDETKAATIGGESMSFVLAGDLTGRFDLVLFRSGEVVFGTGNLTSGDVRREVGGSGSATDGALSLNLVPLDGSQLYLLDLETAEGSIRGSYEAIGSDGMILSGIIEGAPASDAPASDASAG